MYLYIDVDVVYSLYSRKSIVWLCDGMCVVVCVWNLTVAMEIRLEHVATEWSWLHLKSKFRSRISLESIKMQNIRLDDRHARPTRRIWHLVTAKQLPCIRAHDFYKGHTKKIGTAFVKRSHRNLMNGHTKNTTKVALFCILGDFSPKVALFSLGGTSVWKSNLSAGMNWFSFYRFCLQLPHDGLEQSIHDT